MTRRARFTKSEMDRLFTSAKRAGVYIRIVPTKESITIETIEPEPRIAGIKDNRPIVPDEDIIL